MKLTNRIYIKLEERENQACQHKWADDYREDFYVEFVKYISWCKTIGKNATMTGLEKWLDNWWKQICD